MKLAPPSASRERVGLRAQPRLRAEKALTRRHGPSKDTCRYFALAGPHIAAMLEAIMGVAAVAGPQRVRPGPRDRAMREARLCYDHLAGELAVAMFDHLLAEGAIAETADGVRLGRNGHDFFAARRIDVDALSCLRRPVCRACLDWSVRRHHLAGAVGAAVLQRCLTLGWARRAKGSRVVVFSDAGERALRERFSVPRR